MSKYHFWYCALIWNLKYIPRISILINIHNFSIDEAILQSLLWGTFLKSKSTDLQNSFCQLNSMVSDICVNQSVAVFWLYSSGWDFGYRITRSNSKQYVLKRTFQTKLILWIFFKAFRFSLKLPFWVWNVFIFFFLGVGN